MRVMGSRNGRMGETVERRRAVALLVGIAFGPLLVACAQAGGTGRDFVAADFRPLPTLRVAVIPFENLSAHPSAGLICAQLMATELYQRRLFNLLEETEIRRTLADNQVDVAKLADRTYALEVARLLEVDAVLLGSVSDYGYQHGLREEPTVGLNVRLVAATDGSVLWASSHADVGAGMFRRDSVNATAQRVVARMVDALESRIR